MRGNSRQLGHGPSLSALSQWELHESRFDSLTILDAAYANRTFVVVGIGGRVWTRQNAGIPGYDHGASWERITDSGFRPCGNERSLATAELRRVAATR